MRIRTKFSERDTEEYNLWFSFYKKRDFSGFKILFESNGYFDPRPQVQTNLTTLLLIILPFISFWFITFSIVLLFYGWGSIYLRLPIDTGNNETAESKTYGLMFYNVNGNFPTEFWVRGFPKLSFDFPWSYKFLKREVLTKGGWITEDKKNKMDFWNKDLWKDKIVYENHPYKYVLKSGKVQEVEALIHRVNFYWKRWFGIQIKRIDYIEVEFSSEVGERSGSWKGGCISCSYEQKLSETPYETLKRMELERKF